MAQYGTPRRLNALTIFMLLGVIVAGYWFWRFFPSHFDAWTIDHILKEGATEVYHANRLNEPARTLTLREIVEKAKLKIIKQVGIRDPELVVNLNVDGDKATMSADYSVVITHPGVAYTTPMHFHREKGADIKNIKWE